jgi:hypothetical protein
MADARHAPLQTGKSFAQAPISD